MPPDSRNRKTEVLVSPFVLSVEVTGYIELTRPLKYMQNQFRLTVVAVPKGPSTASLQIQNRTYQLISGFF